MYSKYIELTYLVDLLLSSVMYRKYNYMCYTYLVLYKVNILFFYFGGILSSYPGITECVKMHFY